MRKYIRIISFITALMMTFSQYNMGYNNQNTMVSNFCNNTSMSVTIKDDVNGHDDRQKELRNYADVVAEMSDSSYRESVDVCSDSFIIVRNENEYTAGIESSKWYNECEVSDYEVISERTDENGDRIVTYSLKVKDSKDIWDKIDECNSSNECLIAEPVYYYHISDEAKQDLESVLDETSDRDYAVSGTGGLNGINPNMSEQWYIEDQGCTKLWEKEAVSDESKGSGIVVAVLDTGVDYTHEDLKDNMWVNDKELNGTDGVDDDNNGVIDDIYGASFDGESKTVMDENGHGTHVAGIIAMGDNSVGGVGLAHNVKIMAVKAAGSDGVFRSVDIAKAIRYASRMGADVINMSFGSYAHSALVEEALQEAYGTSVLVAAAGNESYPTADSPVTAKGNQYPASYSYVLGVMAHDKDNNLASFSNWDYQVGIGPEYEIVAPGVDMYSTLPGNTYGIKKGTSMAAAVVTSAVAVMKNKLPEGVSSRYVMDKILEASKIEVGGYKRICIKDCYEFTDKNNVDGENDAPLTGEVDNNIGGDVDNTAGDDENDAGDNNNKNVSIPEDINPVILDSSITEDMTLTAGGYYIIDKAVVVEKGVTVNVEPGVKLQFWDGDPKQALTSKPYSYLEVKGVMNFNGSEDKPIQLFNEKKFGGYRVEIRNSGTINMDYCEIMNPYISINEGNHLRISQDYDIINYRGRDENAKLHMYKGGALVEADIIKNSSLTNLRSNEDAVSKAIIKGNYDTVLFDNCCVSYESVNAINCVFLGNKSRIETSSGKLEFAEAETDGITIIDATEEKDIYPHVENIYIVDQYGRNVTAVADGKMEVHILFNRSMNPDILPLVSFGADDPYTDYSVNGAFVGDSEWVGSFDVDSTIYKGDAYFRVKGAVSADDTWLVTGNDYANYKFVIDPSVEAPDVHTEHIWDDEYTVDIQPTCTEKGRKSIHCSGCDEVKNVEEIEALGHDYGEWITVIEATVDEKGQEERICKHCGKEEYRDIEKKSDSSESGSGQGNSGEQGQGSGQEQGGEQGEGSGQEHSGEQGQGSGQEQSGEEGQGSGQTKIGEQEQGSGDEQGKVQGESSGQEQSEKQGESLSKEQGVEKKQSSEQKQNSDSENPVESVDEVEENLDIAINKDYKISQKGSKITVEWGKVSQADGYNVYASYCGKKYGKPLKTINNNSTAKVSIIKLNGKKINLKKNFKIYVDAYKMVNGKKKILANTIAGHVVGRKNAKYTNAKKITLSKSSYTIEVGKSAKIKAKTVLVDKSKKQLDNSHATEFRYASSDENIAKVDKKGKITGVSAGTCTIYVYARNGYAKKVSVTVKRFR